MASLGDLDEVSVTLAEILLFLGDDYGLEGFEEKRNKALVALATYSTACVVPYLVDQCFTKNMSLKNRYGYTILSNMLQDRRHKYLD